MDKKLKIMKIQVYLFDGLSFIIYFLISNILRGMYDITTMIFSMFGLIICGIVFRNFLVVKPYNNMVDYVNELEKNKLEV